MTNPPTTPAPASAAQAAPACPYLTILAAAPILRQGVPVALLMLVDEFPAQIPPAKGRVITLGADAVTEAA